MEKIKANQRNFKKAIQWQKKYNESDNLRNIADSEGNEKAYKKWDKKCETSFNKYLDYLYELPWSLYTQVVHMSDHPHNKKLY